MKHTQRPISTNTHDCNTKIHSSPHSDTHTHTLHGHFAASICTAQINILIVVTKSVICFSLISVHTLCGSFVLKLCVLCVCVVCVCCVCVLCVCVVCVVCVAS